MQKTLLLALGAVLALGPAQARPLVAAASFIAPAADLVSLDLTPYGANITLQVPAGTAVKSWDKAPDLLGVKTIDLAGPDFRLLIKVYSAEGLEMMGNAEAIAKSDIKSNKKTELEINPDATIVVDEPLANRTRFTDGRNDDFMVMIPDLSRKLYYRIERHFDGGKEYEQDKVDLMFTSAHEARLIPKAGGAKPAAAAAKPTVRKAPATTVKRGR